MTLFDDHSDEDVRRAVALVEQTLAALGLLPSACVAGRSESETSFRLTRGSARILVAVRHPGSGHDSGTLRVSAGVIRLPAADRIHGLFARLLELNGQGLMGAAFGVVGDEVVLAAERSVQDLDASEVDALVRVVGTEADRYDDLLAAEFGAVRASDQ